MLNFQNLFLFISGVRTSSITHELREFFDFPAGESPVKKSAFSQARAKIGVEAFEEMTGILAVHYYELGLGKLFHGRRIVSLDGSSLELPDSKEVWDEYPPISFSDKYANKIPTARFSYLYDSLNGIILNAVLSPWSEGESSHAMRMIPSLLEDDILLLDRGYSSFPIFAACATQGTRFCCRMTTKWNCVKDFLESKKAELVLNLQPPLSAMRELAALDLPPHSIKVRLLRVELENGEIEVLCSNLLDSKLFPVELFKELYHLRWNIEEIYKFLKSRMQIENFSGKSVLSVRQDFFARALSANLLRFAVEPTERSLEEKSSLKKLKNKIKVNMTNAMRVLKKAWSQLVHIPQVLFDAVLERIEKQFALDPTPIRPGRQYSRTTKMRKPKFSPAYKP